MRFREIISEAVDYVSYAQQVADKFGVPFQLVQWVMNKETGHIEDPKAKARAVSPAGAQGIMQLMPDTAKWLGVKNPFDPIQNIQGGVKYLKMLYDRYNDPVLVLAAYNRGPGNVDRLVKKYGDNYTKKLPRETRKYIAGYTEEPQQVAAAPAQQPVQHPYRDAATAALAAVTGSRDAYASDQPPRGPVPTYAQPQAQPAPQPVAQAPEEPAAPTSSIRIRPGQTLSSIARQQGTTVDQLMALNPEIKNPNAISAGATLRVQ